MMTKEEIEANKMLLIYAMDVNPFYYRNKVFKIIFKDGNSGFNDKNLYLKHINTLWKNWTEQEKEKYIEQNIVFDKSSVSADFIFILNTLKAGATKDETIELFKKYKNGQN